jgi:tetratricopeptide (TPR) repeat protein
LSAQIDQLDVTARQLLRYSSVLGRSFSDEILGEIIKREDHVLSADLIGRLDRFLETDEPGRYRFKSAIARDTLYEGLPFRVRARLHRAAGEALQSRAANPDDVADDLALHFFRGEDYAKAIRFAMAAGMRSKAAYANAEAAHNFEMALTAARRIKASSAELLEIWEELGGVRLRAGFVDAALDAYRHALQLSRKDRVKKADLLCHLGWAKQRAGRLTSAMRSVLQGIRLLDGVPSSATTGELARLLSLQATIYFVQDKPSKAFSAAESAVRVARETGEQESLIRALNIMETSRLVLNGRGDGQYVREAYDLADQLGDRALQAMLKGTLAALFFYDNQWDDAIEAYREAHSLYEQAGNYLDGAYMLVNLGEILSRQGRPGEARDALERALHIMQASSFEEGIANSEMELARVCLLEDDVSEALTLAQRAADAFAALNEPHFALQANLIKAEALLKDGSAEAALSVIDAAIGAAGREAGFLQTKVSTTRSRTLMHLERYQEAEREIEAGLAAAERQEMRQDEAVLLQLRAELGRRQGEPRPDDVARAQELLGQLGAAR